MQLSCFWKASPEGNYNKREKWDPIVQPVTEKSGYDLRVCHCIKKQEISPTAFSNGTWKAIE